MQDRKPEWALNLSKGLKRWIPEHGYDTSVQLRDELNIPKAPWITIYQGYGVAEIGRINKPDGRIFYARIHLWTDLDTADPRTIPDRNLRVPKTGEIRPQRRSYSEAEYQEWLKSSEAQELLVKKDIRFNREIIVDSPIAPKPTGTVETLGSFIGSTIDNLLNRGTEQVANVLLEHLKGAVLPQVSELERRITTLESAISRLVEQSRVDRTPVPQQRISRGSNDIGQLTTHLTNLLEVYKQGTSGDRDKLMQTFGMDLMALDMVVHPLTRRQDEREEVIQLEKETKL